MSLRVSQVRPFGLPAGPGPSFKVGAVSQYPASVRDYIRRPPPGDEPVTKRPYDDPRWKAVRKAVLERDGHRCQIKRPKCKTLATEVDHITAVSDGGAELDPANLRAACKPCNIGERNATVAARAKGIRTGTTTAQPVGLAASSEMTKAEFIRRTGFDWPEPSGGWPPE